MSDYTSRLSALMSIVLGIVGAWVILGAIYFWAVFAR